MSVRTSGFFSARMGLERAAPVRRLVQKVSGGHFLARGRVPRIPDASAMDVDGIRDKNSNLYGLYCVLSCCSFLGRNLHFDMI